MKQVIHNLTKQDVNAALLQLYSQKQELSNNTKGQILWLSGLSQQLLNYENDLIYYLQNVVERTSIVCDLEYLSHPQNAYWSMKEYETKLSNKQSEIDAKQTEYRNLGQQVTNKLSGITIKSNDDWKYANQDASAVTGGGIYNYEEPYNDFITFWKNKFPDNDGVLVPHLNAFASVFGWYGNLGGTSWGATVYTGKSYTIYQHFYDYYGLALDKDDDGNTVWPPIYECKEQRIPYDFQWRARDLAAICEWWKDYARDYEDDRDPARELIKQWQVYTDYYENLNQVMEDVSTIQESMNFVANEILTLTAEYGEIQLLLEAYTKRWEEHKEECKVTFYFAPDDFDFEWWVGNTKPIATVHFNKYSQYYPRPTDAEFWATVPTILPDGTKPAPNMSMVPVGSGTNDPNAYAALMFRKWKNGVDNEYNYHTPITYREAYMRRTFSSDKTMARELVIDKIIEAQDAGHPIAFSTPYDEVTSRGETPETIILPSQPEYYVDLTTAQQQVHYYYPTGEWDEDDDGDEYEIKEERWMIEFSFYDVTPYGNLKDHLPEYGITDFVNRDYPGKSS